MNINHLQNLFINHYQVKGNWLSLLSKVNASHTDTTLKLLFGHILVGYKVCCLLWHALHDSQQCVGFAVLRDAVLRVQCSSELPVERIFEVNVGSDFIPPNSFGWEYKKKRGLVCAHMHSITWTQKFLTFNDSCPRWMNISIKYTPNMHHPRRRNVTTSMVGLKTKTKPQNGHISKNLTKNGEPQRYSWERRRRRIWRLYQHHLAFFHVFFFFTFLCIQICHCLSN